MKKRILSLIVVLCVLVTSASALTVEQAGKVLETYYIDMIPEGTLEQPTIEEMLRTLGDPYTVYYTAEEYAQFLANIDDTQVVGIGIKAQYLEEGIVILQVAPGSPAEAAGIRADDIIITVDGNDTRGADGNDVDRWIRGEAGTEVEVTVLRDGETFRATLTRQEVVFPTVILEKIENKIGWISCTSFGSNTFQDFYKILTEYDDQVDEWVIDLRENSGGNLISAMLSAGCFGGNGAGGYLRSRDRSYSGYFYNTILIEILGYTEIDLSAFDESGCLTMDPAHVLVGENTASAAEYFCAVIRDSGAGLIIGNRTYGKGIAQTMFNAENHPDWMEGYFLDGDALKVTSERCFSGSGATWHHIGILPHFMVEEDLADEVAAMLSYPFSDWEDILCLQNLSTTSRLVDDMAIPVSVVSDPANREAVKAILSALPESAYCVLRRGGLMFELSLEEAAELCGVTLERYRFSDIEDSEYAEQINTLDLYGILDSVEGEKFGPQRTLSRAEMCVLIAETLDCPLRVGETYFTDVPADAWYAPHVNALYELGLVGGGGDGLFRPAMAADHEQFLIMLARTACWVDLNMDEMSRRDGAFGEKVPAAEVLAERYAAYSPWAREMIWLCSQDLSWTELENIDADAVTTRAEAAAGMCQLLNKTGILPG